MLELLGELGVFLIKSIIIVGSILIVASFFVSLSLKQKSSQEGFTMKDLNEDLEKTSSKLKANFLDKKQAKALLKSQKKEKKSKKSKDKKGRVLVLDFNGDIKASSAESLQKSITQCLNILDPKNDEVVLRLESPGGMVSGYGLAASELSRLRSADIKLSICVDKVAASGGYLMSCVANEIVAAPFAILGSIGVVAGMPNVHKLLKKHDIDYDVLTAGKYKRTLTVFGENTEEGRQKFLDQLEQIHSLFKSFVSKYRPQLDMDKVATGEYWFGEDALNLNLADKIQTSEDFLLEKSKEKRVYHLEHKEKKKLSEKLMDQAKAKIFRNFYPTDFL